jgi:hypothetical protein
VFGLASIKSIRRSLGSNLVVAPNLQEQRRGSSDEGRSHGRARLDRVWAKSSWVGRANRSAGSGDGRLEVHVVGWTVRARRGHEPAAEDGIGEGVVRK